MYLTQFSDYSLRVLILAGTYPDRLVTIAEIAEAYQISENHLMKVVHRLAKIGVLETIRGKGGGLRLAAPPVEINLGAVVRQTENDQPLVECFATNGGDCTLTGCCRLKARLRNKVNAGAFLGLGCDKHLFIKKLHQQRRKRPAVDKFILVPPLF